MKSEGMNLNNHNDLIIQINYITSIGSPKSEQKDGSNFKKSNNFN